MLRLKGFAFYFLIAFFWVPSIFAAIPRPSVSIENIRREIQNLEKDLLQSHQSKVTAQQQLQKIKKLIGLQKKEIQISQAKIRDLSKHFAELNQQKMEIQERVRLQKVNLRSKLRLMNEMANLNEFDLQGWLKNLDADNEKIYFLSKSLKIDFKNIAQLKADLQQSETLEARIKEEKTHFDEHLLELEGQISSLSASEAVQEEILKTSKASRLDAIARMKTLRDSEKELERMMLQLQKPKIAKTVDFTMDTQKGVLGLPVVGSIVKKFGKFFDAKTNLLTFQKGISIQSNPNVNVQAVYEGKVVFVGPLKNYGQVVIIEHLGEYFTLYGQIGQTAVAVGDFVKQGGVIGQTSQEAVYFEVRNRNIAVDPMKWLSLSSS